MPNYQLKSAGDIAAVVASPDYSAVSADRKNQLLVSLMAAANELDALLPVLLSQTPVALEKTFLRALVTYNGQSSAGGGSGSGGSSGGGLVTAAPRVARLESNGNDAAASVGGSPYLTAQAAYDAIAPLARANSGQVYQIQPGLGGFGNIIDHAHDWSANLSIRGQGSAASSLGAIQMRGRNISLTLLDCFIGSIEAQGSTSLGALVAGSVSLRGNGKVGTVDVSFTGADAANPTYSVAAGHINLNGSLEVDTANANAFGGASTGASAGASATGGTISVINGVRLSNANANGEGGASASGKGGNANGGMIDIYGAATVGMASVYAVTGAGQTGGALTGGFLNIWGPFAYVALASAGCNTTNEGDQVSTGPSIVGTMSRIDTVEINRGGVLGLEMCGYINLTLDDDASFNDLGGNHSLSIY